MEYEVTGIFMIRTNARDSREAKRLAEQMLNDNGLAFYAIDAVRPPVKWCLGKEKDREG